MNSLFAGAPEQPQYGSLLFEQGTMLSQQQSLLSLRLFQQARYFLIALKEPYFYGTGLPEKAVRC
jgi:hypothetical protein